RCSRARSRTRRPTTCPTGPPRRRGTRDTWPWRARRPMPRAAGSSTTTPRPRSRERRAPDTRRGHRRGALAGRVRRPPSPRPGIRQPLPPPDPATGLTECRWGEPYRLPTADASGPWPSGVYLARLTASPSGRQAYIVFVVRDDERRSALIFQSSVTTFAAYNN